MSKPNIISTGSHGNAVILRDILFDIGVPYKQIKSFHKDIRLVCLTHQHQDHFNASTIAKLASTRPALRWACGKWLVPLVVDAGVNKSQIDVIQTGEVYGYGKFITQPFPCVHDVLNCGWIIYFEDSFSVLYATDTNEMCINASGLNLYMIESNYCEHEIMQRIADKEAAGEFVYEYRVLQTHLSKQKAGAWLAENNTKNGEVVFLHGHGEL